MPVLRFVLENHLIAFANRGCLVKGDEFGHRFLVEAIPLVSQGIFRAFPESNENAISCLSVSESTDSFIAFLRLRSRKNVFLIPLEFPPFISFHVLFPRLLP